MIPISLSWDSPKRLILLKWNGFFSSGLKRGNVFIKILGISIPFRVKPIRLTSKKIHLPKRWIYWRGAFSFLKEWKLQKVEGNLSFSDPMVNGLFYGWMCAVQNGKADRKINLTINFLGENWCRGEVAISFKALFQHLRKWILPFFKEIRGRP